MSLVSQPRHCRRHCDAARCDLPAGKLCGDPGRQRLRAARRGRCGHVCIKRLWLARRHERTFHVVGCLGPAISHRLEHGHCQPDHQAG